MHDAPRYLLINPRYQDPQNIENENVITRSSGLFKIQQPHLTQPAHWALRLIDLQKHPEIYDKAQKWQADTKWSRDVFCGWLVTNASPEQIIWHIEQKMIQRTPNGKRMLLRFFDPTVMDQLINIINDAQLKSLMGPIYQWVIPDVNRQPLHIKTPILTSPSHITIQENQWQLIDKVYEVNQIRESWLHLYQSLPLPKKNYSYIMKWLSIADNYGLDDNIDRTSFVLLGINYGWRFDRTPLFLSLLTKHKNTNISLTFLIKNLTQKEWSNIENTQNREPVYYEY